MATIGRARRPATATDLLALPDVTRFHEVIAGELTPKAPPAGEHGGTQAALVGSLFGSFSRPQGGGHSGGWWFEIADEIEFEPHEIYRPDVVGWRRDRAPKLPTGAPIRLRPDWICEVLSPSNARYDLVTKFETYRRCGVPHYWLADPSQQTLCVFRLTPDGYLVALLAQAGQRVRAEPFEAIELDVGVLFGESDG